MNVIGQSQIRAKFALDIAAVLDAGGSTAQVRGSVRYDEGDSNLDLNYRPSAFSTNHAAPRGRSAAVDRGIAPDEGTPYFARIRLPLASWVSSTSPSASSSGGMYIPKRPR